VRTFLLRAVCALTLSAQTLPQPTFRFHHLHLNGTGMQEFYARLFDPAVTSQEPVAGYAALRSGPMLLLFGQPHAAADRTNVTAQAPSAIWHFGWGGVTLGETYLRHAAREVHWEPPLPAAELHVHLLSVDPAAAAVWYRDVLGARADLLSDRTRRTPASRPEQRVAEAAVYFGDFAMLIYRTDQRLAPTRGQRTDHVAFFGEGLDEWLARARTRGVTIMEPKRPFGTGAAALIEGPDKIAIELLEHEGTKGREGREGTKFLEGREIS
jgi:catechol 2,3-dioxygenase-like lactoylglutathione lyase family enzyme